MGGYQRTSTLRLFDLLFLASAASAVSLSSFKLISSNGLPLACVIAYNTPISGCTNSDFTTGNTCSSTCIAGIETTEALINSACDQVDPGDNTILILAMNGRLVDALCPNNGGGGNNGGNGGNGDDGGNDDDNKTKTTARVTTSSARSTTTSVGRFTTIPSSSTRSTSSTSSTPFAADPAQSESTTKSATTISKSTTSATSLPVTTGDVLTVTSTASSSRSTATTSTQAAKETDPLDNGGGGSPFDASAQFSAATPGYQVKWWPATLAAVFAAGWMLAH